jgi:hypothetical protein
VYRLARKELSVSASFYHSGAVLDSSDALFLRLKKLTKKFREVNWYSGQVCDRAPPDIELIIIIIIIIIITTTTIIIIIIAYYRSLFITCAVNTCPKQPLHDLYVLFL